MGARFRVIGGRLPAPLGFSEESFLLFLAILIGIVTAAAAVGFHAVIQLVRTCEDSRREYFAAIEDRIKQYKERSLLVLLDPDTGIKRQNHEWEHVTMPEVKRIFRALERGDVLALYQHERYFRNGWLDEARQEFREAVQAQDADVVTVQSEPVAADVALFAAQATR